MSEESTAGRLRFAGLVAAVFGLLTLPRLLLHELWRDEAWLWLVATESRSLANLFTPLSRSGQGYPRRRSRLGAIVRSEDYYLYRLRRDRLEETAKAAQCGP